MQPKIIAKIPALKKTAEAELTLSEERVRILKARLVAYAKATALHNALRTAKGSELDDADRFCVTVKEGDKVKTSAFYRFGEAGQLIMDSNAGTPPKYHTLTSVGSTADVTFEVVYLPPG